MRVCRRWFDIASRHFLAVVPITHRHCKRFLKYLHTHPGLADHITGLRFFDKSCGDSGRLLGMPRGPFNIQLLVSALPLLANLRFLCLVGYDRLVCDQSTLSMLQKRYQNTPISLRRLSFEHCNGVASISYRENWCFLMSELLPVFSVDTLSIDIHLSGPLHYLETPNLVVGGDARYLEDHYAAFERLLTPGGLRGLGTRRWARRDIPILERFLRSNAARNLVAISIGAVFGEYARPDQAEALANNGEPTVCEMLGAALAHCPRLQCVRLGFVHRDNDRSDPLASHDPFLPIVANLPVTLRAYCIGLFTFTLPHNPAGYFYTFADVGLDAVDRTLAPPSLSASGGEEGRFPNLRRAELHVHQNLVSPWTPEKTCTHPREEREPIPLPRLRAVGLLQHRLSDVTGGFPTTR
ncbi:hypothetical protein V8D89_005303 [Ganoderma adspersum]